MKVKDLNIREKLGGIEFCAVVGFVVVGTIAYQFMDKREQVVSTSNTMESCNKVLL